MIWKIGLKSLLNRKLTSTLSIISISLSLALFFSVNKMREGTENGFTNTLSNADLIVGARSGALQLLLYSVFHMGSPTNNIGFDTYEKIKNIDAIDWTIPISLGDSYKGYRVVATNENFFLHYQFRGDQRPEFKFGQYQKDVFAVTLGAMVAEELGHKLGDEVVLSHGTSEHSLLSHDKSPFKVTGILEYTSTPIDRSVIINLEGMEAIHIGWESGVPQGIDKINYQNLNSEELKTEQITAFILRSKNRIALLGLNRYINDFKDEAIMGIIPGVVLGELWQMLSYLEKIFLVISFCVLIVGILGLIIALYTSLNERRREMSILRSLGAKSQQILSLLVFESFFITLLGILGGFVLLYSVLFIFGPSLEKLYSLDLAVGAPGLFELKISLLFLSMGTLAGLLPAFRAYFMTLQDGLCQKN
jgi:putative ABC transport system permease protein